MIAALKLAEWERLSNRIDEPALMGFDDLDSHLDNSRRFLLKNRLQSLGQVFITTPHDPDIEGKHFHIKGGNLFT